MILMKLAKNCNSFKVIYLGCSDDGDKVGDKMLKIYHQYLKLVTDKLSTTIVTIINVAIFSPLKLTYQYDITRIEYQIFFSLHAMIKHVNE